MTFRTASLASVLVVLLCINFPWVMVSIVVLGITMIPIPFKSVKNYKNFKTRSMKTTSYR